MRADDRMAQLLKIASSRLITRCDCTDDLQCQYCRWKEAVANVLREHNRIRRERYYDR